MIYLLKMKRVDRNLNLFLACFAFAATAVAGQNAAPSSHFVFDDNFDGDILINEVRVPKSGVAMYTYYETLGWLSIDGCSRRWGSGQTCGHGSGRS